MKIKSIGLSAEEINLLLRDAITEAGNKLADKVPPRSPEEALEFASVMAGRIGATLGRIIQRNNERILYQLREAGIDL